MASNDEGHGSGDYDNVYLVADKFLREAGDQWLMLLGPPVTSEIETDIETGAETETGAASGSGAVVESKAKRQQLPNKLRPPRLVVTGGDDGIFEPKAP